MYSILLPAHCLSLKIKVVDLIKSFIKNDTVDIFSVIQSSFNIGNYFIKKLTDIFIALVLMSSDR